MTRPLSCAAIMPQHPNLAGVDVDFHLGEMRGERPDGFVW